MKNFILIIATCFIAMGCAAPGTGSKQDSAGNDGSRGVKIESANDAGLTLTRIFFSNDANNLRIADEHCKKFGKSAQFVSRENDRRRYNCVK